MPKIHNRPPAVTSRAHAARLLSATGLLLALLAGCGGGGTAVKPDGGQTDYGALAQAVFAETNRMRADPPAYAGVVEQALGRMSGTIYYPLGSEIGIQTREGPAAMREAIAALKKQKKLPALQWSDELTGLARAHVGDTGRHGLTGHDSSDGRSFKLRVAAVMGAGRFSASAENLAYGYRHGRDVVVQLLVDDGVPGRGHRKNLFKHELNASGVACGPHKTYRHMCVAIYGYDDRLAKGR